MKMFKLPHVRPLCALGSILFTGLIASAAQPVFPGAVGFGTDTVAARNITGAADVYRVKNLDDSGPDSLRYGLESATWRKPRIIIFDVSGVIELQSDIVIRPDSTGQHGFVTVAGQTAPFPGITLKNFGINVRSHDVLIQHIAIRPGNAVPSANPIPPNLGYDNKDCVKIEMSTGETVYNIVFDHVSCSWSMDETVSVWPSNGGARDISFLDCIFADPVMNGEPSGGQSIRVHSKGSHGFGPLVGPRSERTSLIRNLMAFNFSRNPLVRDTTAGAEVVNNLVYRPGPYNSSAFQIGDLSGAAPRAVSAVGNVYIRHPIPFTIDITGAATQPTPTSPWVYPLPEPKTFSTYVSYAIYVNSTIVSGAGLFSEDNTVYNPQTGIWGPPGGDQWHSTFFHQSGGPAIMQLSTNPYLNSGGTPWTPLPNAAVKTTVENSAGKFPFRRDGIDEALIEKVQTNTGTFLRRMSDLGTDPWAPASGGAPRVLDLPANPTADSDNDGYKDVEEWLHGMKNWVEGARVGTTLDAPLTSFDTFTDGNANGWSPLGYTDWTVSSGVYRQSYNDESARAVFTATNWANQVVQARVKPLSFNGSNRFIALFARHRDADNFYYLTMRNAPSNVIEIKKSVNGLTEVIGSTYAFTPTPGTWSTLRLEVAGTTTVSLKAFLNGTQILSATDANPPAQLASGSTAIGTYFATAEFDDVFASAFPSDVPQVISDFDANTAPGWTPVTTPAAWLASGGVYKHTDKTSVGGRSVTGNSATAQTVQADLKIVETNSPNRFGAVYARYTDASNSYYLLLRTDVNKVELKKLHSNQQTLFQEAAQTVNLGQWYTLRLEISGTNPVQLKGYVNGVLRVQGTDATPLPAGTAAVGTNYAAVDFDDVILTSP